MTKVYVMGTCPNCVEVKQRYGGNPLFNYQISLNWLVGLKEIIVLRYSSNI